MYATVYPAALIVLGLMCRLSASQCTLAGLSLSVNSTKQTFSSPLFPADYSRPLSCKWVFTAPEGEVISYRQLTFDVFPSIFCLKDVLDIFDGKLKYSPVLQSWCGGRPSGQTLQTSTRYSMVTFQAVTVGDSRQGFQFEVWSGVKYVPEEGEVHLGPAHLTLVAVSCTLFLLFAVLLTVLARKRCVTGQQQELI